MEIKRKNKEEKISALLEDIALLERYISDLFSFLPIPVSLVSSVGVVLEANPAFEKISGYKIEEIIGEPIEKFFEKEKIEQLWKETLEKGSVSGKEIIFFTKEKKKLIVNAFTILRETEGEILGYFFCFYDLTEIKKREKELKDAQTALLNILEDTELARKKAEEEKNKTLAIITNFADGLFVFDKENKIYLINPQAEKFFGIKNQKLVGKSILELANYPILKPLVNLLSPEIKEIFRKELSIREDLILEVSSVPIISDKEKIGTLVILHDVTREKAIEKMKTEFVSISAHQLRTPLSAMKWILKMLLDGDLGEITKEQREFIEKCYTANERMITLINDLLNVARIEEGRFIYKPILADIISITQSVIASLTEEIKRKRIQFEFKKPREKLPEIKVDVEKISLAIENLIENAIRYTPERGKILVSLEKKENEIEFSVKDTGIGIPKDQQSRIFTKFFRAANAIRMETEGSGLGLFITKNIIEAHGGKIWFESEEGKGTTFYFTLPTKE